MPIVLQSGEVMESQHKVGTKFGGGTLHVTNRALIVEIRKKGIVFHRYHGQMAGISSKGRSIKLAWPENRSLFDFEVSTWGASKIVEEIKKNHPYVHNYSQDGATHVIFTNKQRQRIRDSREEWGFGRLKNAEKKMKKDSSLACDAEMWRQHLLYNHGAVCNRAMTVPSRIEDHLCWNDSWFVEAAWPVRSFFYTLSYFWTSGKYPKSAVHGGGLDRETGAYRIPTEHVRFFHGYPYVKREAFVNPTCRRGFFVPTMTESMRDDAMLLLFWRPDDRLKAGGVMTWEEELRPLLSYYPDWAERTVDTKDGGGRLAPDEVRYLWHRGLLPDVVGKSFGWSRPTPEESEGLLAEDRRRSEASWLV